MKKWYIALILFFSSTICAKDYGDDLIQATLFGDAERVSSLCSKDDVDVNFKNTQGLTALIVAAYYGRHDCAQRLIDEGADVDAQNNDGNTALMYACSKDYSSIVELLVHAGAQVNMQNTGGWTALMHAISFGTNDDIVRFLCEHGADLTMQDDEGNTALALAQECHRDDVVGYL